MHSQEGGGGSVVTNEAVRYSGTEMGKRCSSCTGR